MNRTASFGSTRHPYRATLPLRVLRSLPNPEPEVQARMAAAEAVEIEDAPKRRALITVQDVKDFLLAYCACFIAVSAFLS
jgi:hypothetical protein